MVLGSNFGVFGSLESVWALPGAPWGPLGGQGAPNMGSGSEKLVRWTPLDPLRGLIFGVFF